MNRLFKSAYLIAALFVALFASSANAQELDIRIQVNHSQLQGVDNTKYENMQKALNEFVTNQIWTNNVFKTEERIKCNILINITKEVYSDEFQGTMQVVSSRPVYGTGYDSPMLNILDKNIQFKYADGETLTFNENSHYELTSLVAYYVYIIIGFDYDSFGKMGEGNKDGLKKWQKLAGQIFIGLVVGLTLRFHPAVVVNETVNTRIEDNKEIVVKSPDVKSTRTTIPFFKSYNFNYADLFSWTGDQWKYRFGWIFFVFFTAFIVAAVSNGSNLNDGLDGMAAGNSAIIGLALAVFAYLSSNAVMAGHLNLMFVPGSEEVVVFLAAFVGALIGYLWYNSFPAQIFMGDTGSLTIGGIIAVTAIIIHKELLLIILCGMFIFEMVANLDTNIFIKRGKKSRVFKCAPAHDHYRTSYRFFKNRWGNAKVAFKGNGILQHEVKITIRFWIVTILLAALSLMTLKIR